MAKPFNWSNSGISELASAIDSTQTTLTLLAGTGSRFPSTNFTLRIWDAATFPNPIDDPDNEIVFCTSRSTDTCTVTRGQEATSGVSHAAGEDIIMPVTKAFLDDLAPIPAGTVMLFFQGSPPTGWTQVTTQNDKALRVVSGAGGGAGGTTAFSVAWPSHLHTLLPVGIAVVDARNGTRIGSDTNSNNLTAVGGNVGEFQQRTIDTNSLATINPQFIDVIVASRD